MILNIVKALPQIEDHAGRWVAGGVYLYQVETAARREVKRMVLLK